MGSARGYPPTIGTAAYRGAAADWLARRFGVTVDPSAVCACVGTKEFVASLPRWLSLRDPGRDTVLYPAVAYPTYALGATLAGLRAVPVPVDSDWHLDVDAVERDDRDRALLLWLNDPANPTGASATAEALDGTVEWGRRRGIVVASDECYAEFTYDGQGQPAKPVTALASGDEGVLAVHSLSKRSNMAGLRVGFVAGDAELVTYLGEVRKHAGLMVPGPGPGRRDRCPRRRRARRRAAGPLRAGAGRPWLDALAAPRHPPRRRPVDLLPVARRAPTRRMAGPSPSGSRRVGVLVAPGDLYGAAGTAEVRLALTLTDDQVAQVVDRLAAA